MFGNAHYYIGEKIIKRYPQKFSEKQRVAFLSGEIIADMGRCKLDKCSGLVSDSSEFVNIMKKIANTDEEKYFVTGFEAHIIQDNETRRILSKIFGSDDHRAYMFKCAKLDKYCSTRLSGILYSKCLNRFNFDQVATILNQSGFNIDNLSRKYNIPPKLIKIYIKSLIIWKRLISSKINLITFESLLRKAYEYSTYIVNINEIKEQIGNILGISIIASHLEKIWISDQLSSKIEYEFESLADLCAYKLNLF